MEKNINEIPKKLLEGRENLEGKVVLSYYKKIDLLDDYPLNPKEDLVLEESRLLYGLLKNMVDY